MDTNSFHRTFSSSESAMTWCGSLAEVLRTKELNFVANLSTRSSDRELALWKMILAVKFIASSPPLLADPRR